MPKYQVIGKCGRFEDRDGKKVFQVYNAVFEWNQRGTLTVDKMQEVRVNLSRSFYKDGVNYDVTMGKFGGVLPNVSQCFFSRKDGYRGVCTAPMFEVLPGSPVKAERYKLTAFEPSHFISV